MRSAADIDEVGWPELAAAAAPDRVDAQALGELMDLFVGHRAFLWIGAVQ